MSTTDAISTKDTAPHQSPFARETLARLGSQPYQGAAIIGGLGMTLAFVLGVCSGDGMQNFWHSYLLATCFYTSLALGGLIFIALQYITRTGWSVVVRRLAEIFASSITVCGALFAPIVMMVVCGSGSDVYKRQKIHYLGRWRAIKNKANICIINHNL